MVHCNDFGADNLIDYTHLLQILVKRINDNNIIAIFEKFVKFIHNFVYSLIIIVNNNNYSERKTKCVS